ncbi:MAG TPA: DUF190 domain-containing protein [Sunxiuqinia sp.]|nr:DUF190 domain-containing protein [Sunxiuqinia sp.]
MKGSQASLLKIYISESDKIGSSPLYEEIVAEARNDGLAGATVHRGILSFGASHSIHTMKIFALSNHLPVVIEIVDKKKTIKEFADKVNDLIKESKKGALVTIQDVEVVEYKAGDKYNQFKSF